MSFDAEQEPLTDLGYLFAEASRTVVFVVGSGLSRPAGLPDWATFLDQLKAATIAQLDKLEDTDANRKATLKEKLERFNDPWLLGDAIESALPSDIFIGLVRSLLETGEESVPLSYRLLWALSPSGVVSFNLDGLAAWSFDGASDQRATALDRSRLERFLLSQKPFLLQPHGELSHPASWVLGARARNSLLQENRTYRSFVNTLLNSRRLVIVGFQPKDIAFESLLLESMRPPGKQELGHFWLAPTDLPAESRDWAKLYGIRTIEYEPTSDDHPEIIDILQYISSFTPRSLSAPLAYRGASISPTELPKDQELRSEPVESIRRKLNAALKSITDAHTDELAQVQAVTEFYEQYSGSVHMAWHVRPAGQYDRLWGNQVLDKIGSGSFATVWKVRDPVDDLQCAVKVLHEEVISEKGFLEAFRRGVSAMRILQEHAVPGMVKFIDAYDTPACVVMEYVDGHTLAEAVEAQAFAGDFARALGVIGTVGRIVRRGHELKERVLHRDLKPSNVMIRNLWDSNREDEIVVLDFDLSWYEGAMGQTLIASKDSLNYVAPEQIDKTSSYSSRHTAVDVFGVGMLLYYMCTGSHPTFNLQRTRGFREGIIKSVEESWTAGSLAVPRYLADLVVAATLDEQPLRLGLPSFLERLKLVESCLRSRSLPNFSDLLIMEFCELLMRNGWDEVGEGASVEVKLASRMSSASVSVGYSDSPKHSELVVSIEHIFSGESSRKKIGKYLYGRADRAKGILSKGGYFKARSYVGQGLARVQGSADKSTFPMETVQEMATLVLEAATCLAMSEN